MLRKNNNKEGMKWKSRAEWRKDWVNAQKWGERARTENGRETWGQAMRHRNPGLETDTVMMWRWDGTNARNDNV